ncbi:Hypothetical protein SCF082_LOCUS24976 [Durusdinium trenchii]|uniref:N-acetyltransferase domain-containing protein n=1 Tax=Durusdinium trenchii TaxID=1381693 RepID=A0ABP0LX39_9DINO
MEGVRGRFRAARELFESRAGGGGLRGSMHEMNVAGSRASTESPYWDTTQQQQPPPPLERQESSKKTGFRKLFSGGRSNKKKAKKKKSHYLLRPPPAGGTLRRRQGRPSDEGSSVADFEDTDTMTGSSYHSSMSSYGMRGSDRQQAPAATASFGDVDYRIPERRRRKKSAGASRKSRSFGSVIWSMMTSPFSGAARRGAAAAASSKEPTFNFNPAGQPAPPSSANSGLAAMRAQQQRQQATRGFDHGMQNPGDPLDNLFGQDHQPGGMLQPLKAAKKLFKKPRAHGSGAAEHSMVDAWSRVDARRPGNPHRRRPTNEQQAYDGQRLSVQSGSTGPWAARTDPGRYGQGDAEDTVTETGSEFSVLQFVVDEQFPAPPPGRDPGPEAPLFQLYLLAVDSQAGSMGAVWSGAESGWNPDVALRGADGAAAAAAGVSVIRVLGDPDLEACIEVVARSFAGSVKTAPEGTLDWAAGSTLRQDGEQPYGPLGEPPSEERLALFRWIARWCANEAILRGIVLACKDDVSEKIVAATFCIAPDRNNAVVSAIRRGLTFASAVIACGKPVWLDTSRFDDPSINQRLDAVKSTFEKEHPAFPHWYVSMLATHPDHQGKGLGPILLRSILNTAAASEEDKQTYLECSGNSRRSFYEHFGFKSIKTISDLGVPGRPDIAKHSQPGGLNLMLMTPENVNQDADT